MEKQGIKAQLRKKYKAQRKALTYKQREQYSLDIANHALTLDIWRHEYYHIYLPIATQYEVNSEYVLHILQGKDKQIVVSKSDFETQSMRHFLLTDSTILVENEYGIPEPDRGIEIDPKLLDVVFIPLLAYDHKGNRVGYGKGFYDRFLSKCRQDIIKIGVSFFGPEAVEIPTSVHDVSLNYCISAEKVFKI